MKLSFQIIFAVLMLISVIQASADDKSGTWTLRYESDGIRVLTKPVDHSPIHAFRAITEVDNSLESILALMADPSACRLWIHNCISAEIIDSKSFYHRNTRQVNNMPWPVEDRDLILEVSITERQDGVVELRMENRPDYTPESEFVRISHSEGTYYLTPTGKNSTRIEWVQHMDPGGSLPAWLVNSLLIDVPVQTLKKLSSLVKEKTYAEAEILRDAAGRAIGWK